MLLFKLKEIRESFVLEEGFKSSNVTIQIGVDQQLIITLPSF